MAGLTAFKATESEPSTSHQRQIRMGPAGAAGNRGLAPGAAFAFAGRKFIFADLGIKSIHESLSVVVVASGACSPPTAGSALATSPNGGVGTAAAAGTAAATGVEASDSGAGGVVVVSPSSSCSLPRKLIVIDWPSWEEMVMEVSDWELRVAFVWVSATAAAPRNALGA
eukprot:CAMPEP_0176335708 /NCGR_PEP_ID=MMETSP0121_2-20121125/78749_1 /TAXON_ID=160619 /ORGANISM="Kryptoperidinium foliaceum, Strain CCMP 1326" /LENGTH=168 /DNA_ID=CAMNT_0017678681 /DNA_START=93 /DNA_END=597 /DNA_ORIENTATION=+